MTAPDTAPSTVSRRALLAMTGMAAAAAVVGTAARSSPAAAAAAATATATVQRPWTLGVSGHHPLVNGTSYPASGIRRQVDLVAALGLSGYRVDFVLPDEDDVATVDWSWFDACVDQAERKGIAILAVVSPRSHRSDDWVRERTAAVTARYRGRIPRWQVMNECCSEAIRGWQWEGTSTADYDPVAYRTVRDRMRAVQQGVRSGDPAARTVVNITWKHTGFLDLLEQDGFGHDVNALDWYEGIDDLHIVLDRLQAMPQDEVLVTELNIGGGASTAAQLGAQTDHLVAVLRSLDDRPTPKLRGVWLYELLDQPTAADREAHYGLVPVGPTGAWGAPKPVTRAVTPWLRPTTTSPGPMQCTTGARVGSLPVRPCTPAPGPR